VRRSDLEVVQIIWTVMGYRGTRLILSPDFFIPLTIPLPIGERIDVRGYSVLMGKGFKARGLLCHKLGKSCWNLLDFFNHFDKIE